MDVTELGARVRDAIESAGSNPHRIAEQTGIPRVTLMRRLAGHSSFTYAELSAIADALGVPILRLIAEGDAA